MGLLLLAICIVAAVINEGTAKTVAIVVAVLNGLSMLGQTGEFVRGEPAGATTLLNFLTAVAGLGLVIYALATGPGSTDFISDCTVGGRRPQSSGCACIRNYMQAHLPEDEYTAAVRARDSGDFSTNALQALVDAPCS